MSHGWDFLSRRWDFRFHAVNEVNAVSDALKQPSGYQILDGPMGGRAAAVHRPGDLVDTGADHVTVSAREHDAGSGELHRGQPHAQEFVYRHSSRLSLRCAAQVTPCWPQSESGATEASPVSRLGPF